MYEPSWDLSSSFLREHYINNKHTAYANGLPLIEEKPVVKETKEPVVNPPAAAEPVKPKEDHEHFKSMHKEIERMREQLEEVERVRQRERDREKARLQKEKEKLAKWKEKEREKRERQREKEYERPRERSHRKRRPSYEEPEFDEYEYEQPAEPFNPAMQVQPKLPDFEYV
jgi:hypothetical protein